MLRSLLGYFSNDLAIDLGTANTLIYVKGQGIVINEPSVVAVQTAPSGGRRRVVAVGQDAKSMVGRTPESIQTIRPMKEGVIADFEVAQDMLRFLIRRVQKRQSLIKPKPRIVICVPHAVTEVEKRAVRESAESAGASEVFLVEEPMAAAMGAGLPVAEPRGSMILDIGGGTTEIAILSLKGIVYSRSLRIGGDKMDEAIVNHVKRRHNVLIGDRTAEQIKVSVGSVLPSGEKLSVEIKGRDLVQGVPKSVNVTEDEVREALLESVNQVIDVVRIALEKIPPELASDIVDRGITLSGGGALLRNIDRLLAQETGLPVVRVEDPLSAVVMGAGALLDQPELLKDVAMR